MTALAVREEHGEAAVGTVDTVVPEEVTRAERSMWRSAAIGMAVGVPVCAVLWMGIVALAMVVTGAHLSWWAAMGMAAVVGAFAGSFFGGWAGITLNAEQLEEAERHSEHLA